ncbi:Epoxyqueuosine reductase QueH [bioreactor metagenome]|uniref:Epoxyqueuosine reductase QueH n=1 Tax=bioreactor metagenome TaxID=1076179 RepID=A0A645GIU3_9ZZZZ
MKTLLHVCCAPCSVACVDWLREDGIAPVAFWHNPNIHPFTEYRQRRDTMKDYAKQIDLPLLLEDEYGLRPFVQAVCGDLQHRCRHCYRCRLEAAAARAAREGLESFTTTLLVSPYQNYALLLETGREAGKKFGVAFLERDFRPRFREGQQRARELGLYMQKYCGCIFSEEERYQKRPKKGPQQEKGD